jgi:hypothetical protein
MIEVPCSLVASKMRRSLDIFSGREDVERGTWWNKWRIDVAPVMLKNEQN